MRDSVAVRTSEAAAVEALRSGNYDAALAAYHHIRGCAHLNPEGRSMSQLTRDTFLVACPTLDSLAAALNGLEAALAEDQDGELYPIRLEDIIDITSLPVYADEDADLGWDGVYSWDARRQLVPGNEGWQVEPRWDLEAEDD